MKMYGCSMSTALYSTKINKYCGQSCQSKSPYPECMSMADPYSHTSIPYQKPHTYRE